MSVGRGFGGGRLKAAPALLAMVMAGALAAAPAHAQAPQRSAATAVAEGRAALLRGQVYRAIDLFGEAAERNPAFADAWLGLAECQYELGEYERALHYLEQAARVGPRSAAARSLEGFSLIGLGRLDEARARFDAALSQLPNDRDARFGLALLDLRAGRTADAKAKLAATLGQAPRDARALLAMALITRAEGRQAESASFLSEALRWSSDDPAVCYAAAVLSYEAGDPVEAARLASLALSLTPGYVKARSLLAAVYYESGAYDKARDELALNVAADRSDAGSWYLLGLVEAASKRFDEAEYALSNAARLKPDDELARLALEQLVMDGTRLEDPMRVAYAAYRFERAAQFERAFQYDRALTEYRRGLALDPYANQGRRRYAELLRLRRLPAAYLSELSFLAEQGRADRALNDAMEIYASLLGSGALARWGLGPLDLGRKPYTVAVYTLSGGGLPGHSGGDAIASRALRELLSFSPQLAASRTMARWDSPADALRAARESGADYYLIVRMAETDREVLVSAELRVARSGALVERIEAPRSGNDRVQLALERIARRVEESLPLRGLVLKRQGMKAVADLGRVEGVQLGDQFLVIKAGAVGLRSDGPGLSWKDADVVGRFVVSGVEDEISEGTLERNGFFDRMNPGDILVRAPTEAADGVPTAAPRAGEPARPSSSEAFSSYWLTLFDRVRSLY